MDNSQTSLSSSLSSKEERKIKKAAMAQRLKALKDAMQSKEGGTSGVSESEKEGHVFYDDEGNLVINSQSLRESAAKAKESMQERASAVRAYCEAHKEEIELQEAMARAEREERRSRDDFDSFCRGGEHKLYQFLISLPSDSEIKIEQQVELLNKISKTDFVLGRDLEAKVQHFKRIIDISFKSDSKVKFKGNFASAIIEAVERQLTEQQKLKDEMARKASTQEESEGRENAKKFKMNEHSNTLTPSSDLTPDPKKSKRLDPKQEEQNNHK